MFVDIGKYSFHSRNSEIFAMENFEKEINARGLSLKPDFLASKMDAIATQSVSVNDILNCILSRDLRAVATSKFSNLNVSSMREFSEPVLFQVISVLNIAQPSAKQMVPGLRPALLQLKLTDGQNKYVAIALEDIPKLRCAYPEDVGCDVTLLQVFRQRRERNCF